MARISGVDSWSDDDIIPLFEMNPVCRHKPYVTEDATSAIPTAVLLLAVIDNHFNLVVSNLDKRSDINIERCVAIVVRTDSKSIDLDRSLHVAAFEI